MGHEPGWINCDLTPGPHVDCVFSADTDVWPFPDNSVAEVYSSHVVEHLHNPVHFFEQAYRVLAPNGTMLIRVPYGGHHAAWWDITHVRPWFAESFAFLQPGYNIATGNLQHDGMKLAFGIQIVQMRVSMKLAKMLKRWWWRAIFSKHAWLFDKEIEELWGHFFALKTDEDIQTYRKDHEPHIVGSEFVAWKHHLTGKPEKDNIMVSLGSGVSINGFIARIVG